MAQIIKHRRGSISALKDVTANIGEFVIATGSIGDLNAPIVFVGSDATAGGYKAVSKIYQGSIAPILGAGYGTVMDGTPFYSSTSQSLYILDRNGNINMDLTGNLEGNTISGITINNITGSRATFDTFVSSSALNVTGNTQMGGTLNVNGSTTINNNLTVTGTTNANGGLNVTGSVNISGATSVTGALNVSEDTTFQKDLYVSGNIYQTGSFYTQGDIVLSGSINIGNSLTGDTINFGGEVNSHIIPTTNNTFDLGTSAKAWKDLYVSGTAYIDQLNLGSIQLTNLDLPGYLNVTGETTLYSATTINAALTVTGNTTVNGDFLSNGLNSTLTANYGGNNIELVAYNGATIDLYGPTTINGGLTVTGTTNVNSSLNVTGATTLYSATTINDNLTVTGTTSVSGTTNLGSALNVTGATTLYSATTINADLTVTGTTTLSGSISVEDLTEKRLVVVGVDGLLTDYTGLTFDNGNLNVSGAIEVTNIQGTGSLYLRPDQADGRYFEIYNTGASDVHIKSSNGLSFFGDDTNYVLVDDYTDTITITGVNGVFISSSLKVTGSVNVSGSASVTGAFTVASGSMTSLGGDLYVSGNLQVLGSQTNVQLQSHTVDIGDNIIQVNAYSPFQRYAGLSAYDSGSVGNSGSLLWDSTNDYWLFQNANGTSSKMVGVSGGTFGSESSLTSGTFPIATSGNTIGDSLLTYSGSTLSLNGKFSVDSTSGETKIQGNLNISYSGATMSSGLTSNVLFINSNDDLGFISSTDTTSVTDRLLGYNTSTGNLEFSSLIDGGQY
jgi:predicted acyltransferase (DUF342 family)